jgi:hypothetical protein
VVLSYAKNPDTSIGSLSEDLASLDAEVEGGWVATPRKKSIVDPDIFATDDATVQRYIFNAFTLLLQ